MKKRLLLSAGCAVALLASASMARAQEGPQSGGYELQVWAGGGHGTNGIAQHTGIWNVGVRYGLVLTNPHGPSFLRGRLEYAIDAVPVFWVFQRGGTAYGAAIDPFAFKWMLATQARVIPYLELGGGALFTSRRAPPDTSRVNFTTSGAFGVHILGKKWTWTAEARFMHISNAGLSTANPGINTVQLRLGIGTFKH